MAYRQVIFSVVRNGLEDHGGMFLSHMPSHMMATAVASPFDYIMYCKFESV